MALCGGMPFVFVLTERIGLKRGREGDEDDI
jgi:hypothetical protein